MSFIWPTLLLALCGVPLLMFLYFQLQKRRHTFAARYGSLGLVNEARGGAGLRRHIPATFFLTGITILLFSLARPQATLQLPKSQGTVILAFDVSGSMAAKDFQPTRMEAAKAAARQFVENQPSTIAIGVVVFSDGGISVQAPTSDRRQTLDAIDRLVPQRGTSIGNGIMAALNTIAVNAGDPPILKTSSSPDAQAVPAPQGWYPSAAIVMLTDGENNETPDPVKAADVAANLGVRVYTVGIGSPSGIDLQVNGFNVHTSLNEEMLKAIASDTGGAYYNAGNEEQLHKIYSDLKPKLSMQSQKIEMTSIFAGLGMIVFLFGGLLSLLWFGHVP